MKPAISEIVERPITFSGEMVRAILAGRKTQTRRVIKPQPDNPACFGTNPIWGSGIIRADTPGVLRGDIGKACIGKYTIHAATRVNDKRVDQWIPCPKGKPGDRLWVREKFIVGWPTGKFGQWSCLKPADAREEDQSAFFAADGMDKPDEPQRPWRWAQRMPRWASRITLEVVQISAERLQQMNPGEVVAEGCARYDAHAGAYFGFFKDGERRAEVMTAFLEVWDSINGKKHPWSSNPFVWVIEFKVLEPAGGRI